MRLCDAEYELEDFTSVSLSNRSNQSSLIFSLTSRPQWSIISHETMKSNAMPSTPVQYQLRSFLLRLLPIIR